MRFILLGYSGTLSHADINKLIVWLIDDIVHLNLEDFELE